MGLFDSIKHFAGSRTKSKVASSVSYLETMGIAADADVPLDKIIQYRETDMKFQLAVMMNTSNSVGAGFHNTADISTPTGKACLELINNFCDEWNLDELNQLIAIDVWPSGNAFLEPLGTETKRLLGIQILPVSSFIKIKRDEYGDVLSYIQQWGGPQKELEPSAVYHFKWLPRNAGPFGNGIGQPLARKGVGYKTSGNTNVQRASYFEISEMLQDVSVKMTYAGLPRYDIHAKVKDEQVNAVNQAYSKFDPLEHLVHNFESDVKSISLDTQNKFDSFIRNVNDEIVAGIMTPIPRMFSALNFTYASADAAIEAYLPLIRMYQRAHKRFIENFIYKPLIMQEKNEAAVKKADVQLNWGQQKQLEINEITEIWNILKEPQFDDLYDPNDVLDMIREIAPNIKQMEKPAADMSEQMKALHKLKNRKEKKINMAELDPSDKLKLAQTELIKRIMKQHGK